jgi:hypothetical protein
MNNNADYQEFKDLSIKQKAIELTESNEEKQYFLKKFLIYYSELFFKFMRKNESSVKRIEKKFKGINGFNHLTENEKLLLQKIDFLRSGFKHLLIIDEKNQEIHVNNAGFKYFFKDERPIEEQIATEEHFTKLAEENNINGYKEVEQLLQFILNFNDSELTRMSFYELLIKNDDNLFRFDQIPSNLYLSQIN